MLSGAPGTNVLYRQRTFVCAAGTLLVVALTPTQAPADGEQARSCIRAYEGAQEHRLASEWLEARKELLVCSTKACPAQMRADCSAWLSELSEAIPTVLLSAKVNGAAVTDVAVTLDGAPFASHLTQAPLELNPGEHTFVFARTGLPAVTRNVTIAAGDVARVVSGAWEPAQPAASAGPAAPLAPPPASPESDSVRSAAAPTPNGLSTGRIVGFASLGLAGAALSVGAVAGIMMFSARDSARTECPNNVCQLGGLQDIAKARTDATWANIGFGLGAASALAGAYFVLRSEQGSSSPARVGLGAAATPQGATIWIRGPIE